ncbi:histidine kinase [Mesorhizobium loti]|uniref:histidine kinase n=1 Tax=Rhizobium loti TaxID=381 RepID=A0A117N438_RHILI|nr:histidine kinase [Mesorhizobium loti]
MPRSKSARCAGWDINLPPRDLRLSLHARIIAVLTMVLGCGAILLGFLAWQSTSLAAQQAYDRLLAGGTIQIAENVYLQGDVVALDPPVAAVATLSAYDMVFYKVVDPRGVVVAGYDDLSSRAKPTAIRQGVVIEDGRYQGQRVRIATLGRQIEGTQMGGWATIIVAQTVNARTALAWNLAAKAFLIIGAMSVLALLAVGFAVRFALKPLTRIEQEITQRRPDDLRPIQASPPLEIRNLVQSIDDFMRRLSERMAATQRFIADAAHQIRTPLAALDAQVEVLSNMPPSRRTPETIDRIRGRANELARLTGQLLDHAMVIHRADTAKFAPIDLNAFAKATLATGVPLSLPREVDIVFQPSDVSPVIPGDVISLREALGNLIDNALRHGAASRLLVVVGAGEDEAWVEVLDDGKGFEGTPSELLRPFAKSLASTGSGLGLAIASEVAKAHKGSLSFEREDAMTRVRLLLKRQEFEPNGMS